MLELGIGIGLAYLNLSHVGADGDPLVYASDVDGTNWANLICLSHVLPPALVIPIRSSALCLRMVAFSGANASRRKVLLASSSSKCCQSFILHLMPPLAQILPAP